MSEPGQLVESLIHQCYHYIAMNLEKFPVSYLSLLPVKVREELLWRLPIADLCLLEDTEYVEGFQDVAAYFKLPYEDYMMALPQKHADVARYVEEWDSVKYAKAILYGQVAITVFGFYTTYIGICLDISLPFDGRLVPNDRSPNSRSMVIPLLYAVRKPLVGKESGCGLTFPPRYRDKGSITSKKDIINSVRSWFKCGFPKIMLDPCIREDIDSEYFDLLNEVVSITIDINNTPRTMRFVKQIVQMSSCLEVIVLGGRYEERAKLNFLEFLSTQDGFLSRFRLLIIKEVDVLSKDLGPLITAYFSAPTTHMQKITITDCDLKSYDTDVAPVIDQRYVQFKTIELNGCYVPRQKFSRKAITEWLGEDISILNEDEENVTFQIREKAPGDRKRKYSDVNREEEQPQCS
jgi:hypothetical protein